MLHLAVREHRLRDTTDVPIARKCANLDLDIHRDFTIEKNTGRDIQIHADGYELKVHDRRAGRADKCRLKRSGRDRDIRADFDRRQLSVGRPHLRVLDQLGV